MTVAKATGATPALTVRWGDIDWRYVHDQVRRLQVRIAKAAEEKKFGKVKALQWILTRSWHAKLWAVRRVTTNKGAKTPGIDGVIWRTAKQKIEAAASLQRRGYRPQPLRRIYIPKSNGKKRPLGIPIQYDRAMQALYALALVPVAEVQADRNSYGFRQHRSTADALGQLFIVLSKPNSAQWVLDADIKACFDQISHEWLLANIPMDTKILRAWLKVGYIDRNVFHHTDAGTPQGGIISPILANMALDGLEDAIRKSVPATGAKANLVRYADDLVATAATRELIVGNIRPAAIEFLAVRGLVLSPEKTRIVRIDQGFDFLSCNLRKYDGKLLTKPAKKEVFAFVQRVRKFIRSQVGVSTVSLLTGLHRKLRGWANYYRPFVASATFRWVDWQINQALARWMRRRHKNKGWKWLRKRYFRFTGCCWLFSASYPLATGKRRTLDLFRLGSVSIRRHRKVRGAAHAFDPAYDTYFAERKQRNRHRVRVDRQFLAGHAARPTNPNLHSRSRVTSVALARA